MDNSNNGEGWALIDESLFPNIVDGDRMYPNIYYGDDSWGEIKQQGEAPANMFLYRERECPHYERCFEKEKIIARQQETISDLIKKIAEQDKEKK